MKQIVLLTGEKVIIDDVDFAYLSYWSWSRLESTNTTYAARGVRLDGIYSKILMHRVVMGRVSVLPEDMEVDHKDRNGLNNCRDNLQVVTKEVNQQRATERSDSTTGFKGINWSRREQKWIVRLQMNNKRIRIGGFDKLQEAIAALDKARETMGYGQA